MRTLWSSRPLLSCENSNRTLAAPRRNVADWDPSGVHLFSALAEDVTAFAAVDAPGTEVVFERLAVTEQQIADHGLPTAPPKASDHRSFSGTSTTQAEALPPDVLAAVLKAAITSHRDTRVQAALLEREEDERRALAAFLDGRDAAGGASPP